MFTVPTTRWKLCYVKEVLWPTNFWMFFHKVKTYFLIEWYMLQRFVITFRLYCWLDLKFKQLFILKQAKFGEYHWQNIISYSNSNGFLNPVSSKYLLSFGTNSFRIHFKECLPACEEALDQLLRVAEERIRLNILKFFELAYTSKLNIFQRLSSGEEIKAASDMPKNCIAIRKVWSCVTGLTIIWWYVLKYRLVVPK